jgi:hypothetical membrane protein
MPNVPAVKSLSAFRLVVVGCVAFMVLTGAAMLLFPGGTQFDHDARGYRFFDNFFSDLGNTVTPSGESNFSSMILFGIGLTVAGVSVATFFVIFRRMFSRARRLGTIAAVCGFISAVGFVGVAVTPWNLLPYEHMFCVNLAFRLLLLAVALDTVAFWRDRYAPRACLYIFLAFAVLLVGYLSLLAFGPSLGTRTGRAIQVAGQKIIVYGSIAAIGCQAWIADRRLRLAQETQ